MIAAPEQKHADLVLEGGGVKGVGLTGAVVALARHGYRFPRVAGTSAGAIVAALVAAIEQAGESLDLLEELMRDLDYRRFVPPAASGPVGLAARLVAERGLYPTDYLEAWLTPRLRRFGVERFGDLRLTDPGTSLQPRQRYRLVVHTSDLTRRCIARLPWDLPAYLVDDGDDAPISTQLDAIDEYRVVDAVRASMSIPFFFTPFTQRTVDGTCTWVDGGLLQKFPITAFDRTDGSRSRWPTFGVRVSDRPTPRPDHPVRTLAGIAVRLITTATTEWNGYALADEGVGERTIGVDTTGVRSTDFALSDATRDRLFTAGVRAADAFVPVWESRHGLDGAARF